MRHADDDDFQSSAIKSRNLKIIYWITTSLFCHAMLGSVVLFLWRRPEVECVFQGFGYPKYLVVPLCVAKILGVVAIVTKKSETLKEWAYAGFFFNLVLAAAAHMNVGLNEAAVQPALIVLLLISHALDKKIYRRKGTNNI